MAPVAEVRDHVAHETVVDLQRVERRRRKRVERRVTGAEIIDDERDAEGLEILQRRLRFLAPAAEDRLGDLQRQAGRIQSGAA